MADLSNRLRSVWTLNPAVEEAADLIEYLHTLTVTTPPDGPYRTGSEWEDGWVAAMSVINRAILVSQVDTKVDDDHA